MSWHFSLALEAAYSAEHLWDGDVFAPWKSMPFAPDDSCSAKMKATCHRSQFGTMYLPSTDGPGAELLTWSREGFHAKASASPERGPVSMTNAADYGENSQGWFSKWDRASSLWRTPQLSLFADWGEFSATWPRWGMMRDGACFPLRMPSGLMALRASITSESASGSRRVDTEEGALLSNGPSGNELGRAVSRMRTPLASDGEKMGHGNLPHQIRLQTPFADDAINRKQGK